MFQKLPRLIVVCTVFSTVLAGIPATAMQAAGASGSVSASQTDDDDAGNPRGERELEQEIEEFELENELEIDLFTERTEACGQPSAACLTVDIAGDRRGSWFIRAAAVIRGPPVAA